MPSAVLFVAGADMAPGIVAARKFMIGVIFWGGEEVC